MYHLFSELRASDEVLIDAVLDQMAKDLLIIRRGTLDAHDWETIILRIMKVMAGPTPVVLNTAEVAGYLRSQGYLLGKEIQTPVITIPANKPSTQKGTKTSSTPGGGSPGEEPPPSEGDSFLSSIPTWVWIVGGMGVFYLVARPRAASSSHKR